MLNAMNPYEVRLEVLKLAKQYLDAEHEENVEKWSAKNSGILDSPRERAESMIAEYPTRYTEDDLLSKASNLYNFVLTK